MAQFVIIADDLTGAADTGSSFADAGLATFIPLSPAWRGAADVISCSTESRDLDREAAALAFKAVTAELLRERPHWLYKKIDSALRGHARDELLAVMAMTGVTRALVAPAIPAQGRTTIDGRQYIDGRLLEASHLGGPSTSSDLRAIFANNASIPVRLLDLATIRAHPYAMRSLINHDQPGIIVADAETDDDLRSLALAVNDSDPIILCGAAGFARQLAFTLPLAPTGSRLVVERPRPGPVLVVAGSQHAATARQIDHAARAGATVITLDQALIDDPATSIAEIAADVCRRLSGNRAVIVTTAGLAHSPHGRLAVAERLAEIVNAPTVRNAVGGLVLTGGDVAAKVCAALGSTAFRLAGDVQPGLPWGRLEGGSLPGIPVATKAGSFGADDALTACIAQLAALP
jgi:uncharacterized protein YgbK (DUF1537 family)